MNVYVNDEVYNKIMSIEFKKKLFDIGDVNILEKIGFNDVVAKMYEELA